MVIIAVYFPPVTEIRVRAQPKDRILNVEFYKQAIPIFSEDWRDTGEYKIV